MKRVLVPINEQAESLEALPHVATIAGAFGASVDLVNVRDGGAAAADARLDEARAILEAQNLEVNIVRLEGRAGAQIGRAAEAADLVIMRNSAHRQAGPNDLRQVHSTTLDLLKVASCPVMVVTNQASAFRHPLFAYNGSAPSRRAIKTALKVLTPELLQKGTLTVVTPDPHMAERLCSEIDETARHYGIKLLHRHGAGKPGDVLLRVLEEEGCDLLVMGALGRTWLQEKLFGSTTNRMLRSCRVPLWLNG